MEKPTHLFSCKAEDLPVIGSSLENSYIRDLAVFQKFFPDFDANFQTAFRQELVAAEVVVNPVKFTKELKVITRQLKNHMADLRPLLDRLDIYTDKAKNSLTIAPEDFGIIPLRKKINKKDLEGVISALSVVLTNVDDNLSALKTKGYTAEDHTLLGGLLVSIRKDNTAQEEKFKQRRDHVQNNIGVLNTLWVRMLEIMKAGKALFKTSDPVKVRDYTMANLKKRVSQQRKKDDATPTPTPPAT